MSKQLIIWSWLFITNLVAYTLPLVQVSGDKSTRIESVILL